MNFAYINARRILFATLIGATRLLRFNALPRRDCELRCSLKPPTDTWPTYNGDYSGPPLQHTRPKSNTKNVGSLTLAWAFPHSDSHGSSPLHSL